MFSHSNQTPTVCQEGGQDCLIPYILRPSRTTHGLHSKVFYNGFCLIHGSFDLNQPSLNAELYASFQPLGSQNISKIYFSFLSCHRVGWPRAKSQELDMVESTAPTNGSFHCQYQQRTGKCDVCKIVLKTRSVLLSHFGVKHSIAGCNTHLPATKKQKNQWFVYLEECIHPEGTYQYIGSTDSMTHCWANTKSKIIFLAGNPALKASTGLESHFKLGCSQYSGPDLKTGSFFL